MSKSNPVNRLRLRKKLIANEKVAGKGDVSFHSKYPKLCWWCPHFRYEQAEGGYSEETPGQEFSMRCDKDHWRFNAYSTTIEEFRELLETAKKCKDFKPVDEILNDRNRT